MTNVVNTEIQNSFFGRHTKKLTCRAKKFASLLRSKKIKFGHSQSEPAPGAANVQESEKMDMYPIEGRITSALQKSTNDSRHPQSGPNTSNTDVLSEPVKVSHGPRNGEFAPDLPDIVVQSPSHDDGSPYALPDQPSKEDKRFMNLSEHFPCRPISSESLQGLTATVSDNCQADEEIAILDKDIKRDGAFRVVYIRFDGDPEGKKAQAKCIMHDTGSSRSLTFESKLADLGIPYEPLKHKGKLTSVTGDEFSPVGRRQISFSYQKRPGKLLWADVLVLKDPPVGSEPSFDFLLGRDFIKKEQILIWNKDIIGYVKVVGDGTSTSSVAGDHLAIPVTPRASFATTESNSDSIPSTVRLEMACVS